MSLLSRHFFTSAALGLCLIVGHPPALAAEPIAAVATPVIDRLGTEGYLVTGTRRSWFGRVVILATRDGIVREVVLNRTTGAILSDRLFAARRAEDDGSDHRTAPDATTGAAAPGPGGHGRTDRN